VLFSYIDDDPRPTVNGESTVVVARGTPKLFALLL